MVNTKPKVRCVACRLDWLAASLLTARMYRSALSRWPPPRHMKWRPRHTTSSTSCALSTFVDQSWRCCGGCCIRVAVFVDIVGDAAAGVLASSTARIVCWSPPPLLVVPVSLKMMPMSSSAASCECSPAKTVRCDVMTCRTRLVKTVILMAVVVADV